MVEDLLDNLESIRGSCRVGGYVERINSLTFVWRNFGAAVDMLQSSVCIAHLHIAHMFRITAWMGERTISTPILLLALPSDHASKRYMTCIFMSSFFILIVVDGLRETKSWTHNAFRWTTSVLPHIAVLAPPNIMSAVNESRSCHWAKMKTNWNPFRHHYSMAGQSVRN